MDQTQRSVRPAVKTEKAVRLTAMAQKDKFQHITCALIGLSDRSFLQSNMKGE
jgi:hypothetical protein